MGRPATAAIQTDFAFLIDASGSMGDNISAVRSGLGSFVSGLNAAQIDARFSITLFGGPPELVLDWTSDGAAFDTAMGRISTSGAVSGFQINHNQNPEGGLECLRIILNGASNNTLLRGNVGGSGPLGFRLGARKNIILVTDEDSDQPEYTANRFSGQTTLDPPSTGPASANWPGWQAEIDAAAIIAARQLAFVNMLVNPTDAPSRWQYGDPSSSVADADFLNYDPAATLANLVSNGYGQSLEAQILRTGLIARAFDIRDVNDPDFIDNFFAAKIEETQENPLPTIPEPSSLAFLLGLLALRRKRA